MAFSKIIYNGTTLMDVTGDTVTASVLTSGYTAHDASGTQITGTGSGGGSSGNWMGMNPTKIQTYTAEHALFKDTDFSTWTWTTTNTTLRSSQEYTTMTGDDSHDYIQIYRFYVHYDYGNWTPTYAPKDFSFFGVVCTYRYASSLANVQSETLNAVSSNNQVYNTHLYYFNSNGNLSHTTSGYGLYVQNPVSPTLANASTSTPSITWKSPALCAKGASSYFNQTAFNNLNMNTSYYDATCEIWRVDAGTSFKGYADAEAIHIINNGL